MSDAAGRRRQLARHGAGVAPIMGFGYDGEVAAVKQGSKTGQQDRSDVSYAVSSHNGSGS